ncbi:enoyl-CoA hydratase/isomerase family protein [Montanilutibacter psychrotolerans]|uniref:Enoyl-CoA hydratase/isomerase family protein n=1 Tax=Montanilutibacter psychrotolerans TaxID=1327343 RepID=A0A3M8SW62_9GAMM|nr:enoyl-CoA hydratase/isomerase family protein [Lysobacter psychrotolerans]RNF85063.1 enoyl-CoA hydratase/isomerase family protein [Lysobacter psychrotolerans]
MSLIETIHHGDVVELQLARAPVNALNPELCLALRAGIDKAVAEGAGGIVLSGGQKVFSAGLDVPHLLSLGEDRAALTAAWQAFFDAALAIAASPVPVVAAIAGHAPAGGCVLALCCDYRVMVSGPARIGLNETQVGLVAPEGIQRLLRRVVGDYRAERLLVAGEMVDAGQALQIGLVDELVEVEHVAQRARLWLEQLLALPRAAMLQTRAIARADVAAALQPQNIELPRFIESWYSAGTQQALHALVDRLRK